MGSAVPIDHLLVSATAVPVVIILGAASKVFVKRLVRVVEPVAGQVQGDGIVTAHDPGEPLRSVDRVEFAVDVDLLQLVDQNDRRIAVGRNIAGRDGEFQSFVGAVAELFHDAAGLGTVLGHVGIVAGQGLQHIGGHAPYPLGRRQHRTPEIALALGQGVDKRLPVHRQCHRPAPFRLVEGHRLTVHHHVPVNVRRHQRAGGFRVLPLGVFQERHLQKERRGYVNLAGDKGQDPGRRVSGDGILDAVEIGPALLPVLRVPGDPDIDDPLSELAREGARRMLAQALVAEADAFVALWKDSKLPDGRDRVVRHGHGPHRAIQTGVGPVEVRRAKVRDRGEVGAEEKIRFTSSILPKWARRTKSLDALLPVLYLRGVSTGDFPEALTALLGKAAPNLSPAVISRLTAEWQADYDAWQNRELSARRYVYVWADGVYLQARMEPAAE